MKIYRTFVSLALLLALSCALKAMDPATGRVCAVPGSADEEKNPTTSIYRLRAGPPGLEQEMEKHRTGLKRRASLEGHEHTLAKLYKTKAQLDDALILQDKIRVNIEEEARNRKKLAELARLADIEKKDHDTSAP